MSTQAGDVRVGVDIGGTFTDIAVQIGARFVTTKVLTTPRAPEQAVMEGIASALAEAGVAPGDVDLVIHGTTLATNALIERKGARTAMIGTEGHRDTLELGYEDRFSEYDVFIEKPAPLIPRDLRFTVPERMSAKGEVLRPLDESAVAALVPALQQLHIQSLAIGLLHAYVNPDHERRVRHILATRLPGISISLSSEVCAEVREYDRFSTTACNAYVQPLMAGYLDRLSRQLKETAEAFARAHELGMFTVLWCYLRNSGFKKDGVDYHASADLTAQANHLGVTIEADIIKQKLPENNGGYTAMGSGYGKTSKLVYETLTTDHPIDLCRWQVANCYMGRIGLINSGGASSGATDLAEAVRTAVINKRAGGLGLISGRKAFQRPMAEGVELLNAIQDVYLDDSITVA